VSAYFYSSVAVLALMLFFPVRQMIWVLSVRRIQRRQGRELTDAEIQGQRGRAAFVAVLVAVVFSWLFNLQVLGMLHG
jgi:hypothetical protein